MSGTGEEALASVECRLSRPCEAEVGDLSDALDMETESLFVSGIEDLLLILKRPMMEEMTSGPALPQRL